MSALASLRSAYLRYRFLTFAIAIAAVGVLLMLLNTGDSGTPFLRDLGSALFTAGTIGVGVEYLTRREFEKLIMDRVKDVVEETTLITRLEALKDVLELSRPISGQGLRHIHPNRHAIDFDALIRSAEPESEIRLMGVCMSDFATRPMQKLIREKLEQKCRVKLLILNPQSDFARTHASGENLDESEPTFEEITLINGYHRNFIGRVPGEAQRRIELRHYEATPHLLLVATNRTVIVGFYLRGARGEQFPHLEMEHKQGGICIPFVRHFDSLWGSAVSPPAEAPVAAD